MGLDLHISSIVYLLVGFRQFIKSSASVLSLLKVG